MGLQTAVQLRGDVLHIIIEQAAVRLHHHDPAALLLRDAAQKQVLLPQLAEPCADVHRLIDGAVQALDAGGDQEGVKAHLPGNGVGDHITDHHPVAALLQARLDRVMPLGTLDINLYRDDWTSLVGKPSIGQSRITESVDEKVIILIDDVLYTGRTIRAALEALLDYGRPRCVELLALIDRGHRELPIHADYVGRVINTSRQEHVDVMLAERDGEDSLNLTTAS